MVKIEFEFSKYDVDHVGKILARIRESRGVKKEHVAMVDGYSNSTIARIETFGNSHHNKLRNLSIQSYIKAVAKSRRPLTNEQIKFLNKLEMYSSDDHIRKSEELFSEVQFCKSYHCKNTDYKSLVELLEKEENPSAIIDPLWFIHAMNGSMFRLFGIEPESNHLNRWDSWHVIATKFHEDSPVRKAHYNPDVYFPPVIDKFFTDETASIYLFTPQMRLLLQRIHKLSAQFSAQLEYSFTRWWDAAISFSLDYALEHLNRIIIYQGKNIVVQASKPKQVNVEVSSGCTVPFSILSWEPFDNDAKIAFKDICNSPTSHKVYFAADYDLNQDFHVNFWPEFLESSS